MVLLFRDGVSVKHLAARVDVSRTTICAVLDAVGVARPSQRMTAREIAEAVDLYGQGLSIDAVGNLVGRSAPTVRNALLAEGVVIRDTKGRPRVAP